MKLYPASRAFTSLIALALLLASSAALFGMAPQTMAWAADPAPYYDEVFDADGNLRPQYADIYPAYKHMTEKQKKEFRQNTYWEDFRRDNSLEPFPRVLTESEGTTLIKGVEQRSAALRAFLQEYYGGGTSWQAVIPEQALNRIIARSGELGFKGKVKPESIAFPYGPDIMRTSEGKWVVIEDNPGFIGGPGDLKQAFDSMAKRAPQFKTAEKIIYDPMEYHVALLARAKARAIPPGGKVILYTVPPAADNEDMRIAQIYRQLGIERVTPGTKKRLVVKPDGVYLKSPDSQDLERVGYIFLGSEHKIVDAADPAAQQTLILEEAKHLLEDLKKGPDAEKLRKALLPDPKTGKVEIQKVKKAFTGWESKISKTVRNSAEGLLQAIYDGKVATNYAPGLDFIGDKEFYTYVDDLVRHYLKEEPVVSNINTSRFLKLGPSGKPELDEALMKTLFEDDGYKNYVIKVVDGRGGDGVFIGPKLTPAQLPALVKAIRANPESYIVQDFKHLSVLADHIVDLRMISEVGPKTTYVTRSPWGRGIPLSGDGKVNLSAHGKEFMIGIVPDPGCSAKIRRLLLQ